MKLTVFTPTYILLASTMRMCSGPTRQLAEPNGYLFLTNPAIFIYSGVVASWARVTRLNGWMV